MVGDGQGALHIFGLDGTPLRTLALTHADGTPVVYLSDISTDANGNLYVVEGSGPNGAPQPYPVLVYDPNGKLLLTWTGDDTHPLKEPWIVAPDDKGNMYIVDFVANTVQKVHVDLPA
jgi:sugar lactone lactonase YvrE